MVKSSAQDPRLNQLLQRYTAIEQLYAQQDWPGVEAQCHGLLADLGDAPGDPLRPRLLLLLAHTQLYGHGDAPSATRLYTAVLAEEPEATLVEMAQRGLAQCEQAEQQREAENGEIASDVAALAQAAAAAVERAGTATAEPLDQPLDQRTDQATERLATSEAAMPWAQELGRQEIRRPAASESDLALAPFQRPVPAAEEFCKPLRWPFMADHVEQPAVERPSVEPPAETPAAGPRAGTGGHQTKPAQGPDTLETAIVATATERRTEAARPQASTLLQPELEIELLDQDRFNLEEIVDLSKGLLRVSLSGNGSTAEVRAALP